MRENYIIRRYKFEFLSPPTKEDEMGEQEMHTE